MSNTNRNPKELKGLIERSKSKEITIRAKSRDGFAIRWRDINVVELICIIRW